MKAFSSDPAMTPKSLIFLQNGRIRPKKLENRYDRSKKSVGQKYSTIIHSWVPPPDGLRSLFLEGIREIAHDHDYEIYIASSGFTNTI